MAQSISNCLVCNTTSPVDWKCLECDFTMCNNCRTYHGRFPATREHTVLKIGELTSSLVARNPQKVIQLCKMHNQYLKLYCYDCQTPACLDCITVTHRKHEWDKIEQVYEEQTKYKTTLEDALNRKTNLAVHEDTIKSLTDVFLRNANKMKEAVKQRQTTMKQEIDRQASARISDIDKTTIQFYQTCDSLRDTIGSDIADIEKHATVLEKSLYDLKITDCRTSCASLKQVLDHALPEKLEVPKLSFNIIDNSSDVFGKISVNGETTLFTHVTEKNLQRNVSTGPCCLCKADIKDKITLRTCKHEFCKKCILKHFKTERSCPTCGTRYDVITGHHPAGSIRASMKENYFEIYFNFRETYNYFGPNFETYMYLPINDQGRLVFDLLQVAFRRQIIFTADKEIVSIKDEIMKKIIHYYQIGKKGLSVIPSSEILDAVLDVLATKGVTEVDL